MGNFILVKVSHGGTEDKGEGCYVLLILMIYFSYLLVGTAQFHTHLILSKARSLNTGLDTTGCLTLFLGKAMFSQFTIIS